VNSFDSVSFRILWSRLVGVAEEAGAALRHAAFSSIVSEGNDCTVVLFDEYGRELAEPASYTATSFIGTLPLTMKAFLSQFPPEEWREGDVLICNDPWLGTGHVFDIQIAAPVFADQSLVGFTVTCSHTPHIGGNGGRVDSRSVFEEGLRIPPTWLYRNGDAVTPVFELIRANVPRPQQVLGDIAAQVSAHAVAGRRIREIMHETGLHSWSEFTKILHETCDVGMRRAIQAIPDGTYSDRIQAGDSDLAFELACSIDVERDHMTIDFTGSSGQVDAAINCPLHYTLARSFYALKAMLLPSIPNNEATFRAVDVVTAPGSIVDPSFPAATAQRHVVGHFVPTVVMRALSMAAPAIAIADGAGPSWTLAAAGEQAGGPFSTFIVFGCGQGASARAAGVDCVTYPGNSANTPIEVLERETSLIVLSKELRRDSGGAGGRRGGLGQRIRLSVDGEPGATLWLTGDRTVIPARGFSGGGPGRIGAVRLNDRAIGVRSTLTLGVNDELVIETPGGGAYGLPQRDEPPDSMESRSPTDAGPDRPTLGDSS
jgi:N-methylhydantoinase B